MVFIYIYERNEKNIAENEKKFSLTKNPTFICEMKVGNYYLIYIYKTYFANLPLAITLVFVLSQSALRVTPRVQ